MGSARGYPSGGDKTFGPPNESWFGRTDWIKENGEIHPQGIKFMVWKSEFCNILFSKNQDHENFDKANRLKFSKLPKSLFRFRVWKDYSLKEISENKIWLSNPRTFNDPYDCFV